MPEDRRFFIPDRSLPFSVALIGISFCTKKYHIKRAMSPFTVMEYVVEGEGYVVKDGDPCLVGKDSVYICPAGVPHDYYSSAERPWTKIWMNIYGSAPTALLKESVASGTVIMEGRPLKPLFEELRTLIYSEKSNEECQSEIFSLYIKIINGLFLIKNREAKNPEALEMKMLLDSNTHRLVSNGELSAHIYRSPDYCVKLFKQEFGTTPYNYQLEQKMSVARKMLAQTDIPVYELAEVLGYSDAHYFSGLFKSKCGSTPTEYRKRRK